MPDNLNEGRPWLLVQGPESRHKLKIIRLQLGDNTGAGAVAIRWAREALQRRAETERRYRKARAQSDGWTIEIIGDMPAEIGLCVYDPATRPLK